MNLNFLLKFRYLFVVAVLFLLVNSIVFLVIGAVECINGYKEVLATGFQSVENNHPGERLLEGLDNFVSALVFMIFGLGLGQLFVLDKVPTDKLPRGFRVENLKALKVLLWETILVALVIYCITHLLRTGHSSWEILLLPGLILILAVALFFMKYDPPAQRK